MDKDLNFIFIFNIFGIIFIINFNGEIFLLDEIIDREIQFSYSLIVMVKDGKYNNIFIVEILVEDMNDNWLMVFNMMYVVEIYLNSQRLIIDILDNWFDIL